jgi:hypothetical protein
VGLEHLFRPASFAGGASGLLFLVTPDAKRDARHHGGDGLVSVRSAFRGSVVCSPKIVSCRPRSRTSGGVSSWIGITILAVVSTLILIGFGGITDRLIPLFAVGAFGAFTLSQAGMVLHWKKKRGKRFRTSLVVNAVGAAVTFLALVIIVIAKFTEGARVTFVLVLGNDRALQGHLAALCEGRARDRTAGAIADMEGATARGDYPDRRLEQGHGTRGPFCARDLERHHGDPHYEPDRQQAFAETLVRGGGSTSGKAGYDVPKLEVIHSPFRQVFQPILDFVEKVKEEKPDALVAVVVPEVVHPRWWEYLLHNHRAMGLKAALFLKGDQRTVVINTPWYLRED